AAESDDRYPPSFGKRSVLQEETDFRCIEKIHLGCCVQAGAIPTAERTNLYWQTARTDAVVFLHRGIARTIPALDRVLWKADNRICRELVLACLILLPHGNDNSLPEVVSKKQRLGLNVGSRCPLLCDFIPGVDASAEVKPLYGKPGVQYFVGRGSIVVGKRN